jgi:CHAT domain-containing protein/Tfp pilus assembly protein PilF
MIGRWCLVAVLCLLWSGMPAAHHASEDSLAVLISEARKAIDAGSWDEAAKKLQSVIESARDRHDELWEARGIAGLGSLAYARARYAEARQFQLQALSVFERLGASSDVGRAERDLGNIAINLGKRDEATDYYRRSIAVAERTGDALERLRSAFALARLATDVRLGGSKLAALDALRQEAHRIGERVLEARILHSAADTFFEIGEYEPAIRKLNDAAAIFEETGERDELSTVYNSLGRIFRVHGQVPAALQAQLKALAIQDTLDSPRNRIQSLNAVAVTYQALGDASNAREYFERAIALAEKIKWSSIVAFLRGNYGDFLVLTGDVEHGRSMIQEAIDEDGSSYRSIRYFELSRADERMGRNKQALSDAEKALAACGSMAQLDCVSAHLARAWAELKLGDAAAALADQTAAVHDIERFQTTLAATDFLKQGFAALWQPTYSIAIDLHARKQEWRAALETAEQARARAFLDLMASRHADSPAASGVPVDLTWRGAGDSAGPVALRSDANTAPSTVADLVAIAAAQHSTLLQYWVADETLYAWVVTRNGAVHGARVDMTSQRLEHLVRSVAPGSTTSTPKSDAWKALYAALILPVEPYLPAALGAHITIVPHGPLLQLPFAALRDPHGQYLVERYTLSFVPAAAMLRLTDASRRKDARSGSMLLVANPATPPIIAGEPPLPRLPGAVEEARAIAQLVPASRTMLLAGASATESRVLDAATHKAVIHFATHAIVRDADPWSSFLALGVPADGGADGKLTASKVYGLALDADLVVLSACRSGGGLITGDGIASLARAFFYAGASSLIVSVWDVADEPAERLLPAFYRAWLAGADKAEALRSAQLDLIHQLRAGEVAVHTRAGDVALVENPALWAGFVLIGDPR